MNKVQKEGQKKIEAYKERLDIATNQLKSIKKKSETQVEGYKNEILILKKQVKTMEKQIIGFAPLEDRELKLLNIGKT